MLGFQLFRLPLWTVAFQAKGIRSGSAQQVIIVSAVRLVAGSATLRESRLVVIWLLRQISDVAMAAQADVDRIRFWQPWLVAGVWTVAVSTVARSSGMLHFRRFNELGFVVVAGNAEGLGARLRQHHFPILRRGMANVALLVSKGRMRELCHQFGSGRLVRIVAAHAIGSFKGLVLMSLLQVRAFYVMASDTKFGHSFGEMEVELGLTDFSRFVGDMATVAAHIESGVAAAFLGYVQSSFMAAQAKVFFLIAGSSLQQLKLVV